MMRIARLPAKIGAIGDCLMTFMPPLTPAAMEKALYAARLLSSVGDPDPADAEATDVLRNDATLQVLVAEDNPVNQKVTRRILEHANHTVHIVTSGDDALDALERADFDVFIVDINMPGLSGLQVVKLYRMAHLDGRRLPIVALTADATPETRKMAEEAGIDLFLTKPVEAKRLLDAVARVAEAPAAQNVPAADHHPSPQVTQISSHPRFRSEAYPAINWSVIDQLSRFADGDDFVRETLEEYIANGQSLLVRIKAAAAETDARAFRDGVHALRGTSGNVGAEALTRLCQDMHGMTRDRLCAHGDEYVCQLQRELARFEREFARTSTNLGRYTSGRSDRH